MSTDSVDLREALRRLNEEVGVPLDRLVRTVEQALAWAYKRQFEPEGFIQALQVRSIAREAGLRTKVAVESTDPGVDPVGACVGPKGVRHRSLLEDLPGEHVDIVHWSEDPARFVAAALGPAPVISVDVNPETRTATVLVPRDHLSLAIGRDGQNARLAARLTGLRVDIHPAPEPEPEAPAEGHAESPA